MDKTVLVYFYHIRDAIQAIHSFIGTHGKEEFTQNQFLQSAVIRQLEIIGEASAKIQKIAPTIAPDIPWKQIIAARNHLIHGYFVVNIDWVWTMIQKDLPKLDTSIAAYIAKMESI